MCIETIYEKMVSPAGFEPALLAHLAIREYKARVLPLHYGDTDIKFKKWWASSDSNRGPYGYEPQALTAELLARLELT